MLDLAEVPLTIFRDHPRRWLLFWGATVALLTLGPGDPRGPATPFLCFPCGNWGTADAILNVALFVPAGILLGWAGAGILAVAALGFGSSMGIEAIQTVLPGRYPTAADVVANGGGALLGLLWVRWGAAWLDRARVVGALAALTLVLTAFLARPAPPAGRLFGQHTPELGGVPAYEGTVIEARVAGLRVPSREVDDSEALRAALGDDARGSVVFRMARPVDVWTPVFAVFSAEQEEALFVAVRHRDLLLRTRTVGGALRLRAPAAVVGEALPPVPAGDPVSVAFGPGRNGRCIEVAGVESCGYGVRPHEGWRFLLGGDAWDPWRRGLMTLVWVGLPFVLLFRARGTLRERVLIALALLALALSLPFGSALALGGYWTLGVGMAAGSLLGDRWRPSGCWHAQDNGTIL